MKPKWISQIYAQALLEREAQARRDAEEDAYRSCPATAHLHENFHLTCTECLGKLCAKMVRRGLNDDGKALPYQHRPICAALTRIGAICANRVIPGKTKCHMHGGKSTGPKTPEGKAKIAAAQRLRWAKYRAKDAKD